MQQRRVGLIGAGPVGIEMAVALKLAGVPYVHLEAGQVGATMVWWAAGTRWFSSNERISIAGVPLVTAQQEKATREEYLAYLRSVVGQFGLEVRTCRVVTGVARVAGGFEVRHRHALFGNSGEERERVTEVILATGGTAAPNMLGVPGEGLAHVSHYFRDPHVYFGTRLLIVGGRNSAVEAALRCHRAGAKVTVAHYAEGIDGKDIKYWLYPEFMGLMKSGAIVGLMNTRVEEILPESVRLVVGGERREVGFDYVLLMTGYQADMSLARGAGVALDAEREVPVYGAATMETNVKGLYVIGTATAGTQRRYKVFLENCHVHVGRVMAHLKGERPPTEAGAVQMPES